MKDNKIASCIVLQVLIFLYFWAMGLCITGITDIREWPQIARTVYVTLSVLFSTGACIAYLKTDLPNERE
jgi:hypothetical protein